MFILWYFDPDFKAPFRNDDVVETCQLACDYLSTILNDFIARLPEYRLQCDFADWLADEPTLADRVHLIFPQGFGDYNVEKNHNPEVWPWFVMLSDCVHENSTMVKEYATVVFQYWSMRLKLEEQTIEKSLHNVFDFFTAYLQLFVALTDPDVVNADFKYPPEDGRGNLIGTILRKP